MFSLFMANSQRLTDKVTLKNVTGKDDDSLLLLNERPSKPNFKQVSETDVLKRLRSLLPQLAAANDQLSSRNVNQIDVDIKKVALDLDESDTSSSCESASTDEEQESDEENERAVEFDLSVFRAKDCIEANDVDVQVIDKIPEGFQETHQESTGVADNKNKKKILIQEI